MDRHHKLLGNRATQTTAFVRCALARVERSGGDHQNGKPFGESPE